MVSHYGLRTMISHSDGYPLRARTMVSEKRKPSIVSVPVPALGRVMGRGRGRGRGRGKSKGRGRVAVWVGVGVWVGGGLEARHAHTHYRTQPVQLTAHLAVHSFIRFSYLIYTFF